MLRALLGKSPEMAPLKRMLTERTDGNPFFLEESVRHLVETGVLAREGETYRVVRMPSATLVPSTIHAVLASRIDRLQPEDKRLLQAAAAIGKDFSHRLLEAVADAATDDVARSLARLRSRELVDELRLFPDVEYTFRHALTHEVAYGGLLRDRRRALDARIVAALEAQRGETADGVDRLADHALRGELWEKALAYCRSAGHHALARFANRTAATHFEHALTALGHLPEDDDIGALAIDLRLELRSALLPLGQYRRILDLLSEARRLADAVGDRRRLGGISSLLCNYFTLRFEFAHAIEHGTTALEIARTLDDPTLAVVTNSVLSAAYYGCGEYRRAIAVGTQAISQATDISSERFGMVLPPSVYAGALVAWSSAELGDFPAAYDIARQARRAAETFGQPHSLIFAELGEGIVHLRQGASADAIGILEQALALWESADLPAVFLEIAGPLASAYCEAGRAADAIALLERAVAHALLLRHRMGNLLRSGGMAEAYMAAGRAEEALPLAQLYVEMARFVNARGHIAWALRLLADVAASCTPIDAGTCHASITECLTIVRELGMRPLEARALLIRARLLRRLFDDAAADADLRQAAKNFADLGMTRWVHRCSES